MNQSPSESEIALWKRVVRAESEFYQARMNLFSSCSRRVIIELVRTALDQPTERVTALGVAGILTVEERQQIFRELLSLASFGHGLTGRARELIVSLPKDWVLANIEGTAEPLLQLNEYEEYQRLLELYVELDRDLALRLARRAAVHENEDIKEAGKHFLELLGSE